MQKDNTKPYNSTALFLVTIGLVMVNTLIFSYLGRYLSLWIWNVDIQNLVHGVEEYGRPESAALRLTQLLSQLGGFIFSVFIVIQMMKKELISFTKLHETPSLKWFLISIIALISFMPGLELLYSWNQGLQFPASIQDKVQDLYDQNQNIYNIMLRYNSGIDLYINLFVMALIPAVSEELLFRGLILRIFNSIFKNIHTSIWLTAIIFAVIHFQVFSIVPMILMAALFGYFYYFTGSLWVPIILHFLNNSSVILMKHYGVAEDSAATSIGLSLAFFAIGLALLMFMNKKAPKPNLLTIE